MPETEQEVQALRDYFSRTGLASYDADEALGLFSAVAIVPTDVGWKHCRRLVLDPRMFPSFSEALEALDKMEALYWYAFGACEKDPASCCPVDGSASRVNAYCSGYLTGLQMCQDAMELLDDRHELEEIAMLSDRATEDAVSSVCEREGLSEDEWHRRARERLPETVRAIERFIRKSY